jgi:hypothetical protein
MWECSDNQDVGLEAATIQRKRNSSLVKCSCADNVTGLKLVTEAVDFSASWSGRRAIPSRGSGGDEPAVEAWDVRMPV